ncbi:hypothetical protein AYB33_15745 [Leptospira santarosai]|nr:hypothetical protein AYB33_15745 [Leptospira santarosai]
MLNSFGVKELGRIKNSMLPSRSIIIAFAFIIPNSRYVKLRSFGWLYSDFMEALSSYIALLFPWRILFAKVDFIKMPYSKF